MDDKSTCLPTKIITTPHTPKTHAYRIPHVDIMNTQACESIVAIDYAFVRNDIIADIKSISMIDRKGLNTTDFSSMYSLLHCADDSMKILSDAKTCQTQQLTSDEVSRYLENQRTQKIEERVVIRNDVERDDETANAQVLSNVDHEVGTIEELYRSCKHDVRDCYKDYYEIYNPSTAKDTLLFPHHSEIYEECVRPRCSPVYTDRLIYAKQSLFAVEVVPRQRDDIACFEYLREGSNDILYSQYRSRNCMLVCSYMKTNAAGIFYSHCWPQDIFDLKTLLKPNIRVISHVTRDTVANAHLYHRYINNCHARVPRTGCTPMIFYRNHTITMSTKRISHNDNSSDLLIYAPEHQSKNENDIKEHQGNRPSLLLLEPLLLAPELTSSGHRKNMKNRIVRSERVKVVRIIIVYILSFLILASITFYIVYFT